MSSSSARDYMMQAFGKKGLALNMTYLIFLVSSLVLLGWLATSNFNSDSWGTVSAKVINLLTIVVVGVTGHLLQGPFGNFANVLFVALLFFIQSQYQHYSVAAPPAAGVLADLKQNSLTLFWIVATFGVLYLMFVFFPNDYIPTAEDAYAMMKRKSKMAAPAAVAAPSPSA